MRLAKFALSGLALLVLLLIAVWLTQRIFFDSAIAVADKPGVTAAEVLPLRAVPTATAIKSDELKNTTFSELQHLPLSEIKSTLDMFWQRCRSQQRCEAWLQQLQARLTPQRFQLLSSYPEKMQQLAAAMGQDFISHDSELNDKIARIKQQHSHVFGELATQLFAKEYALYAYKAEVAAIAAETPDTSLMYKIEALERIQQQLAADSPLLSPQSRYQQALGFIDQSQSGQQIREQTSLLAERYLDSEKAQAISQRQQQMGQQQAEVDAYQQGMDRLQQTLAEQRAGQQAEMPSSEWQAYKAEKIRAYRKVFFAR